MIDHIVVDLEIAKTIEETPGGWDDTHVLGVACLCLYSEKENRLRIYGGTPEETEAAQHRILQADRITTFNGLLFDYPVLWAADRKFWTIWMQEAWRHPGLTPSFSPGVTPAQLCQYLYPKSNDLLHEIWKAAGFDPFFYRKETHGGFSLEKVALGTIGIGKIGYGGDAPKWHQAGEFYRVANYCADDVMLTYDLSTFISRYGYVISPKTGKALYLR